MLVCLFVCLYTINVKRLSRSCPNCVGPYMTQGKVNEWSKSKNSIVIKFWKSTIFLWNLRTFFVIVLQCLQRENVYNWNWQRSIHINAFLTLVHFMKCSQGLGSTKLNLKIALHWKKSPIAVPILPSKRLKRLGPYFVWGLTWPHVRFMDAQS